MSKLWWVSLCLPSCIEVLFSHVSYRFKPVCLHSNLLYRACCSKWGRHIWKDTVYGEIVYWGKKLSTPPLEAQDQALVKNVERKRVFEWVRVLCTSVKHWWSLPDDPKCSLPPSLSEMTRHSLSVKRRSWASWRECRKKYFIPSEKREERAFLCSSLLTLTHEYRSATFFPMYPWMFWPVSHSCHWLALKQQTNCVFVFVWVCGCEKASAVSHTRHLLFLCTGVSVHFLAT